MTLSALLIGSQTLTQQCGELWLARGHVLTGLVSDAPDLVTWAEARAIPVHAPGAAGLVGADWILSIANLALIAPEVLALARQGAVNFHDGPLPERGGLNVPIWALLEGARSHGITWHRIEGGIDAGRILTERRFDIAPGETALSLNTRCFEAGLDSFPEVIDQLERGVEPRPQAGPVRAMHRRADRPRAQGRLDFTRPATELLRLVEALDHGRWWNPVATAKIAGPMGVWNLARAALADGTGQPGQVLEADAESIVVACGSGAVRLGGFTCQAKGLPVSARALAGAVLPSPGAAEVGAIDAAAALAAQAEPRLRRALRGLEPLELAGIIAGEGGAFTSIAVPDGHAAQQLLALLRALGAEQGDIARAAPGYPGHVAHWEPLRLAEAATLGEALSSIEAGLARPAQGWSLDLLSRDRALAGLEMPLVGWSEDAPVAGTVLSLAPGMLHVDSARLGAADAARIAARIALQLRAMREADPATPLADLPILPEAERLEVIETCNASAEPLRGPALIHAAFAAQVALTPDAVALSCEGQELSYAQLEARANRAAHRLQAMGVQCGTLVGLCLPRSLDLVVGALAILKAGGAYVPMDPAYPPERLQLFAEDSGAPVIVTHAGLGHLLPEGVARLELDRDAALLNAPEQCVTSDVAPEDVAYMIYTSGSTGRPKGVMVEHRNVANFFQGMDAHLGTTPGTWLAVTSLSFDISVLELFWTLSRGFKVVIASDENRGLVGSGRLRQRAGAARSGQGIDMSLYYWGNDDGPGPRKYELLLEGAKFADANGFCAVWTPERHFHAFGGPYPNPAVTGAAVAAVTRNIDVRAGSCVVPLHHPARIAEEWAVIDNLTDGRAGIAIASGWHPDDFVLNPANTPPANKAAMFKAAQEVRALWRGEGVAFPRADGTPFTVTTLPRPVSAELPLWVTTAGNPDTWIEAGRIGANVLTHLLGQSIDEVAERIRSYHGALREAGHDPADFTVTLMLHTLIGADRDDVRARAEGPMKAYLAASAALVKQYAWAFPAFRKPKGVDTPMQLDLSTLDAEENAAILDFAFQRYFEDSGLFGTIEDGLARIEQLKRIGVSEVACLIDYGVPVDQVLEGLRPLAELRARANAGLEAEEGDFSLAAEMVRHQVTHLQCTPSMARMIAMNDEARLALGGVGTMLVGGEALPGALAEELRGLGVGRLINVYGPTETTIWSSAEVVSTIEPISNIGRPLANQQLYVLDEARRPVGIGIAGELWIGGLGVSRGYWQRPDLTAERFLKNPFHAGRMYRTGDLVRRRSDGRLDFIGRADHQVKLRGYRIELGEIEAVLEAQPGVSQAVALAREDRPGDLRLVAYVTGPAAHEDLRRALKAVLPEHMMPAHFVTLASFPLTPNRKVDRKALPAPQVRAVVPAGPPPAAAPQLHTAVGAAGEAAGEAELTLALAAIWQGALGLPSVSPDDNFFTLGGHSLLAVQVHREIRDRLGLARVSITDIFRFPVLSALARHLSGGSAVLAPGVPVALHVANTPRAPASDLDEAMARRRALRLQRRGLDG